MRRLVWFSAAVLLSALAPALRGQGYGAGPQRPGYGGDPWSYNNGDPGRWDNSWNNRPNPRAGACFFSDRNFGGNHFCVPAGQRLRSLPGNFGDNISSIQVYGRGAVRVFDDRDFRGNNTNFRGAVADLRAVPSRPGHTWNNRISSIVVR